MATRQNLRKSNGAERAHNAAAVEATMFGTTAGAMLLGILTGAADVRHADTDASGPRAAEAPAPPVASGAADQPAAPSATDDTPHAHDPPSASLTAAFVNEFHPFAHASVGADSVSLADGSSIAHGYAATSFDTPLAAANAETSPSVEASIVTAQVSAPEPFQPIAAGSHDAGPIANGITETITTTLDASLSSLSTTISDASNAIQSLTSAVSLPDLSQLADSITTTAASLTQWTAAAPAAAADALIGAVFEPRTDPAQAPPLAETLFDVSDAVPVAAALAPLQLGFIGQPQADGHETHDGAFSALGLHHF